jgi:hypothetical protein
MEAGVSDDHHDRLYRPTILDRVTGRTHQGVAASLFWWTEGNGSCDCNRGPTPNFDVECKCERFVVVDVDCDEGEKASVIAAMNQDYR